MRRKVMHLVPALALALALALLVMAVSTAALATHEVADGRSPTPLEDFRGAVGAWLDPWVSISETDIADDHAPLVAHALYEELVGIKPESCYYDTYAAYWAVAADLRALGEAPTREQQEAEFGRVFEDLARADALAELDAVDCVAAETEEDDVVEMETTPTPDQSPSEETGSLPVIEIEATAALQFSDLRENRLEEIAVTPGELPVIIR